MSINFDLEQKIMECWNITGDLKYLLEAVMEHDASRDEIANVLLGLEQLYEMKFNSLFLTFEVFLKEYYLYRNVGAVNARVDDEGDYQHPDYGFYGDEDNYIDEVVK